MDADGDGAAPAQVTRFVVDAWKTGPTTSFVGTENVDVLLELDADGSLTTRYVRGDVIDELFARVDYGTTTANAYWYLTDHQGSIRDIVDASGTVVNTITYDGYGRIVAETNPALRGNYAFTGREWEAEIDLQYNRGRYYDPATGRWISQDPLGFDAGDSNLYRYVHNRPTGATDPSGLEGISPIPLTISGSNNKVNQGEPFTIPRGSPKYYQDLVGEKQFGLDRIQVYQTPNEKVVLYQRLAEERITPTLLEMKVETDYATTKSGSQGKNVSTSYAINYAESDIRNDVKYTAAYFWGHKATWIPGWGTAIHINDKDYAAAFFSFGNDVLLMAKPLVLLRDLTAKGISRTATGLKNVFPGKTSSLTETELIALQAMDPRRVGPHNLRLAETPSAPASSSLSGAMDTIPAGRRLILRPVVIEFPARGLTATEQQLFAAHLAEQEMTLNRLSLATTADLELNLLNYQNIGRQVERSRTLARQYLPGDGAGLDAAHALDAVAGGYTHEFVGFRSPIQQYIGSLWRTRTSQIQPGRVHRLVPRFEK